MTFSSIPLAAAAAVHRIRSLHSPAAPFVEPDPVLQALAEAALEADLADSSRLERAPGIPELTGRDHACFRGRGWSTPEGFVEHIRYDPAGLDNLTIMRLTRVGIAYRPNANGINFWFMLLAAA